MENEFAGDLMKVAIRTGHLTTKFLQSSYLARNPNADGKVVFS